MTEDKARMHKNDDQDLALQFEIASCCTKFSETRSVLNEATETQAFRILFTEEKHSL